MQQKKLLNACTSQVDILLACHGKGLYLSEQIESITQQTYPHWRLILRNDGPLHPELHKQVLFWQKRFPQIIFYADDDEVHGVNHNFCSLLSKSTAPYIMFCDADDLWKREKVEKTLFTFRQLEKKFRQRHGDEHLCPVVVFSDMQIVNSHLVPLHSSFWQFQNLAAHKTQLNHLLVENVATGHTMMLHQEMKQLILPFPPQIAIYDWWIALMASAFNELHPLPERLGLYRQHAQNLIGAKRWGWKKFFQSPQKYWQRIFFQAKALEERLQHFPNCSPPKQSLLLLKNFHRVANSNRWSKAFQLCRHHYLKNSLTKNLQLLLSLTLHQGKNQ